MKVKYKINMPIYMYKLPISDLIIWIVYIAL